MKLPRVTLVFFFALPSTTCGFSSPIFQTVAPKQVPSKAQGVEIELPDFDELFNRIQQVSPLARVAIEQNQKMEYRQDGTSHFDRVQDDLKWTTLDSKKGSLIHQIDKIENFQKLGCPILRFRSSMKGPCIGYDFAEFIMNVEQRAKWDPSINQVYEAYPIKDLDAANIHMGFGKYGDCSRLGVGYCQTKSYLAVSGREQLTLCGIQDFQDGSCVIWGTEMEEWHNHLLPEDEKRSTRSKSHLFCTTLVPTGPDTFDVEYALQIDIGGRLPGWITTPILVETIKSLFRHAQDHFKRDDIMVETSMDLLDARMKERNSILMTP